MASETLIINSRDEFLRIKRDNIIALESDGNFTNIILANKSKALIGMNLRRMQEMLVNTLDTAASCFARIGKRHIVNLQYVYRINFQQQKLYLSDGENFVYSLPVSKEALKSLRALFVSPESH